MTVGSMVRVGALDTHVVDEGAGAPVLLLHGSGPGVSALANWRLTLPALVAAGRRTIAPDLIGFGQTVPPTDHRYTMESWVEHVVALMDVLDLDTTDLVGNSFGGALALRLAIEHPERVRRLVLMGSVGVPFEITPGLQTVWGYRASVEGMREVLDTFTYDGAGITDDLAQLRYESSIAEGADQRFAAMFPAPRQRWVDAMASHEDEVRGISAPTLLVHGRDDRVIPVATSQRLLELIPRADLHVFGQTGHWTQIERTDEFNTLLVRFLDGQG
ncbi:alpha/beta fold hydrolase [Nocardioides sp. J2M5]|nr:alpha/beta fold hydrolase [Nocardioides palaemonis]